MTVAHKIIRNFLILMVAQAISGVFHYGALVYLARTLGPGDFGKVAFSEAMLLFFMIIATLGLDTIGTRELGRDKEKVFSREFVDSLLTLRVALGIAAFTVFLLFTFVINKPLDVKYLMVLYGLSLLPLAAYLDWVFQGTEQMSHSAAAMLAREAAYLVLVMFFVNGPADILLVPVFFFLSRMLSSSYLAGIFRKFYGNIMPRVNTLIWRALLKESIPIGMSMVMAQIMFTTNTIMLAFMRSNEEVGYYNAAYKIILFIMGFASVLNIAVFPVMSDYFKTSIESLGLLTGKVTKLTITFAIPLAVGGTVMARPLMNIVYGDWYDAGVIAFQILIWSATVAYCNSVYARGLFACDRQKKYLAVVSMQTVTIVVLSIILIPPYGVAGAAISMVAAEASGFLMYYKEFTKVVDVKITGYFLRPIISSAIMAAFLSTYMTDINFFILIIAGAGIYIVSLYFIKGITMEEIRLFRTAITGRNGSVTS